MSNVKSSKLVVMGDVSVGKTSLLHRYLENTFDQFNESTIGAAFFTKKVDVSDNLTLNLEIWDTAGQERYDSLLPMYYRGANVILLVFDVNNPVSFENLKTRWLSILNDCGANSVFFLVGNKCDLQEMIHDDAVQNLIDQHGDIDYFKVSAKEDIGLDKLFSAIVEKVVERDAFKIIDNMKSFNKINSVGVKKKSNCC